MFFLKVILGLVFFVMILSFLSGQYNSYKINKLVRGRSKLTKNDFVKSLVMKGYELNDIEIVYEEICQYITNSEFSLYPEDDLYKDVQIDEFEDNELINSILKKIDLEVPSQVFFDEINSNSKIFNSIYILEIITILRNNQNIKIHTE